MGFMGLIPVGGHCPPSSGVGARLEWRKAQRKPRKKDTSDVMNRIIPYRRLFCTWSVWWPWNVLSRIMSRHHRSIPRIMEIRPKARGWGEL